MSESDKEGEPSSVSSVPGLLSDLNDANSTDSVYRYRDFSHVGEEDDAELAAENPPPTQASRGNSESSIRVQKFPVKLYAILAQKEFHDIITWMPHGRSWKVLKPSLFESMVMPLFFEYSNYHSFNRLVNAWSFRRISSGPDRGSYYHELFLRGMPHLQKYMRRLPKTHKKLPMSKKDEPDFYALDKTNPLPPIDAAPVPGAAATSAAVRNSQQYQQQQNGLSSHYPGQQQQGPAVVTPPQPRSLMRAPGLPGPGNGGMNPQAMQDRYMRLPQEGPGSLVDEYYDNSLAAPASAPGYPAGMNAPAMPTSNGYGGYPALSPMRPGQMHGGGAGSNQFYQHGSQYSPMDNMMQQQQQSQSHHQQHMDSFQGGYGSQVAQPNNYYQQSYGNSPAMGHHQQQMGYGGYDGSAAAAGSLVGIRGGGGGMNFQQQQQQGLGNEQGEAGMMRRPVPQRPVMGVE